MVRTLPALDSLRRAWPSARIDWAVEPSARDVLQGHPALDGLLLFPRSALRRGLLSPSRLGEARRELSRFLEALRNARYDLVIDFQGTLKTGLLSALTRAPRRAGLGPGHSRELAHLFYNERPAIPRERMSRVDRALALVRGLGVQVDEARGVLPEAEADGRFAESFLARAGIARPIVLFPGTSRAQAYKRYPPRLFGEAAARIAGDTGTPVVVAWGPGEEELAEEVASALTPPAVVAPAMSVGQLGALIRRARLFLSGDTGPMHMAWMAGTPVVAIFGPTDPILNRPGGDRSAVVSGGIYCAPCRNRGCVARSCLEELPPEQVARAALGLLARVEAGR